MVKQYPHQLKVFNTPDATQDENGNFSNSVPTLMQTVECRAEVNGGGKFTTVDGEAYSFQFAVFMPLSSPDLAVGGFVQIKSGESELFSGEVKRFSRGQLNCRLWV